MILSLELLSLLVEDCKTPRFFSFFPFRWDVPFCQVVSLPLHFRRVRTRFGGINHAHLKVFPLVSWHEPLLFPPSDAVGDSMSLAVLTSLSTLNSSGRTSYTRKRAWTERANCLAGINPPPPCMRLSFRFVALAKCQNDSDSEPLLSASSFEV